MIRIENNQLCIEDRQIILRYPIKRAFHAGGRIIVLYERSARPDPGRPFRNLVAIDLDGRQLWEAELPEKEHFDSYVNLESTDPLVGYTFSGYLCEIDASSGRIRRMTFVK